MKNVDSPSDRYEEIERLAREAKSAKSKVMKERIYIQLFNALLEVSKSRKKKPTQNDFKDANDVFDNEQVYVLDVISDSFTETLTEYNKQKENEANFLKLYFKIYKIKSKKYLQSFYGEENEYRKAAVRDLLKSLAQRFKTSVTVENKKLLNEAFIRAALLDTGIPEIEFDSKLKEIFENKHIVFASERDKDISDVDEDPGHDMDSAQSSGNESTVNVDDTGDDVEADSSVYDDRVAASDLRDDPVYQKMIAVFEFVVEMLESPNYSDAQKQNIRCYMTWKVYEHYEKVYLDSQYEFMDDDLWSFIGTKKNEDEGMKIADILACYLQIQPDTARKCLKKAEKDIQSFVISKMRVN